MLQRNGNRTLFLALIAAVGMEGHSLHAHHAIAAAYIPGRQIAIEGKVVSFVFREPHSFVYCDGAAKDDRGQTTHRWTAEWVSSSQLARDNVTPDQLKPGDRVIITGNPGRNPAAHRIRVVSIRRLSDGWQWISTADDASP